MPSIGVLAPIEQTYGWYVMDKMASKMGIDAEIIGEKSQPKLLIDVLNGTSRHVACLVAYSNNLGKHAVPEIGEGMKRYARTDQGGLGPQRFIPEQLLVIARTGIEQCLIGKEGADPSRAEKIYAHSESKN